MNGRDDIVAAAREWIGTPFHHRASLKGTGCDCLGLVHGLYREVTGRAAGPLPAYPPGWGLAADGEALRDGLARHLPMLDADAAGPGDVLLFRWRDRLPASHLGVMTGADRMIHAHRRGGVCEVALAHAWRRRIVAAFRFPD